jgi:ribose transport system permease protein
MARIGGGAMSGAGAGTFETEPRASASPRRRAGGQRLAARHGWTIGVVVLLVVLLIVEANSAPVFSSFDVQSLVIGSLPLAFAAMAQAVIVISGGIDLSIGAQMALTNVIAAQLMKGHGMGTAVLVSILVIVTGIVIGTLTGSVIVATRVPDIVVTLATSFVWAGVALIVLPRPGGGTPSGFQDLSTGAALNEWIPNGLLVLAAVFVLVWLPLRRRRLGLAIYAVGSQRDAAYLSGVRVGPTRIAAYAVGGGFAALGGLALASTTGVGSPLIGDFYTLQSVAAVVLGGVALVGGKGGLIGPVMAAFILTVVVAILTFLGVDANYGQVIQGTLIIVVVMIGGLVLLRKRT